MYHAILKRIARRTFKRKPKGSTFDSGIREAQHDEKRVLDTNPQLNRQRQRNHTIDNACLPVE
jgi:hypothetical protein